MDNVKISQCNACRYNPYTELKYILAIDPSLSSTGYVIIGEYSMDIITTGRIITSSKYSTDERIHEVCTQLYAALKETHYNVTKVVMEDGFMGNNARTGLQLAALRGAITEIFKWKGFEIHHMMPTEVRKALGCKGSASKQEVTQALQQFYHGTAYDIESMVGEYSNKANSNKTSDVYDALAVGVAYAKTQQQ